MFQSIVNTQNINLFDYCKKMQKTEQELIDIADKMLAQLENDYWQTQQCNLVPHVECPEEEVSHEDYHVLDGDDEPDHMSDDEDEVEAEHHEGEAVPEIKNDGDRVQSPEQNLQTNKAKQDLGELVEVFPTEEWKAPEKQININSEKIKQLSLNMNLPVPEWMKDEELLKNRITELFGKKAVK